MILYVGKNDEGEKQYLGTQKEWATFEQMQDEGIALPEDLEPNDNDA